MRVFVVTTNRTKFLEIADVLESHNIEAVHNVASLQPLTKVRGFLGSATAVEPETVYTSYD